MSDQTNNHILETEFFGTPFFFSYSSLNKLLYSPQLFYRHYVLKQKEEEIGVALVEGKLIHCLLLDPESLEEQFLLLPGTIPSDNPKKVIESVYQHYRSEPVVKDNPTLEDYKSKILEVLKEVNLYQSLKTDEQRLEKILTDANKEYFSFLLKREGKTIIDISTLEHCLSVVEHLKIHPTIPSLIGQNADQNVQVFNELPMQMDLGDYPFGIKGIIDNLVIDVDKKVIRINDLKTTSKTISEFQDTVEFYKLWLQAALYKHMVTKEFIENNNLDSKEWKITFTFIVVDKYTQIYPFEVSEDTMNLWTSKMHDTLEEARWHYDNRNFDLPSAFARGQVFL